MGTTVRDQTPVPVSQQQAVAAPQADAGLLNFVAMAVRDPNIDVTKLEALLRMQREIVGDDARTQFNRALHEAQMAMPRVAKNGIIDLGKGKIPFATWDDVDAALRPIMRKHGFSLSFNMRSRAEGGFVIEATLTHAAGHSKNYEMPLPNDAGPGRNALQAAGSTLSYGKRYLAEMIFNIVRGGEDDDGRAGGREGITPEQKDRLINLMQEVEADTKAFLGYMQIANLDEMEAKDFPKAINALMSKKRKAQGND